MGQQPKWNTSLCEAVREATRNWMQDSLEMRALKTGLFPRLRSAQVPKKASPTGGASWVLPPLKAPSWLLWVEGVSQCVSKAASAGSIWGSATSIKSLYYSELKPPTVIWTLAFCPPMVDHALRKMSMAVDAVLLRFSAYSLIYGALCTLTVAGEFCWFFPVVTSLFFPPLSLPHCIFSVRLWRWSCLSHLNGSLCLAHLCHSRYFMSISFKNGCPCVAGQKLKHLQQHGLCFCSWLRGRERRLPRHPRGLFVLAPWWSISLTWGPNNFFSTYGVIYLTRVPEKCWVLC